MQETWVPFAKQALALSCDVFEMCYGGARGPGKTEAGIMKVLRNKDYSLARSLVLRRNSKDLLDWVDRAFYVYKTYGAKKSGDPRSQVVFTFPSGYKVITGHLKDPNSWDQFQGQQFQIILIEELTQIADKNVYIKLLASCRSTIPGLKPKVFCTTNPTGPGAIWVKEHWGIKDGLKPIIMEVGESQTKRAFIPAVCTDNPILVERDPQYIARLKALPEKLCQAWYYGRWDSLIGTFFENLEYDLTIYNPNQVYLNPRWPRVVSIDWGYDAPMAIYWHACAPNGMLYTYREIYEKNILDSKMCEMIHAYNQRYKEKISMYIGDPSSFGVKSHVKVIGGEEQPVTRREKWLEHGIYIQNANNSRIPGWTAMREYLEPTVIDNHSTSMWKISSECKNLIKEICNAKHSDKNGEDIDKDTTQDHALDSCRYFIMSRPPIIRGEQKKISISNENSRQAVSSFSNIPM